MHHGFHTTNERCSCGSVRRLTHGTRPFGYFVSPSSPRFTLPNRVPRGVETFYETSGRTIPRDSNRLVHSVCRDLTVGCHFTVSRVGRGANGGFSILRLLNNNAGSNFLYRVTTGDLRVPITTNPARTATLNGVVLRLVTLNSVGGITRNEGVVGARGRVGCCTPTSNTT